MLLRRLSLGAGGHLSGRKIAVALTIVLTSCRTNALGDWALDEGQASTVYAGVGSSTGAVGGDSQLQAIPSSGTLNHSSEAANVVSIFSLSGNQFTDSVAASRVLEIGPGGSDVGYANVVDEIWLDVSGVPSSAVVSVIASNSDPQSELGFHWQLVAPDGRLLDLDEESVQGVGTLGAAPTVIALPLDGTYWLEFRWWLEGNAAAQSAAAPVDAAYSTSTTFSVLDVPEPGAALGLCAMAIAALDRRRRRGCTH